MKYAVVKIKGKQYQVTVGQTLLVNKLEGEKGQKVTITDVLLLVDEKETKIGQPLVDKVSVELEILEQTKGDKIRVAKFKAKSRYRRVTGFRAKLTNVKVLKIG